jgi:pilus assembly protein Flp/PilA
MKTRKVAKQAGSPRCSLVAPSWNQSFFEPGDIQMLSIFRKLMKNDDGATAIEYVLIASLISVAAITAMGKVGGKVSNVLSNVANAMT